MHVLTLTTNEDAPFMTKQMEALEERGVSFTTLSVPGEVEPGVDRGPTDYLRFFPQVRQEAGNGYDLIHAHYGLTAPMALGQRQHPVVLSLWGTDLYGPGGPVSKLCSKFCDATVVMSEEMRSELGRDCAVIPDGVDLEQFRPMPRDDAREAVGWSDDEYHVLFPYPPERTVKNYPRASRIVGVVDGLLDKPVSLEQVWGIDHGEVATYMNAADVLLLTSEREGSPNAVKEALACNLPVVATDVGDVSERLRGVEPSTVATSDEDLVEGLITVLEREERSNGREAVREVSIDATADRMLSIYERVADAEAVTDPDTTPVPAARGSR